MGRLFRDLQSEIIVGGILAGMSYTVGFIQDIDPVIFAVIVFVVLITAFRIVYYFQNRKIAKRLNIGKERWNKIREEKINYRARFEDCKLISNELLTMHEMVKQVITKQLSEGVDKEKGDEFIGQLKKIIVRRPSILLLAYIYKIPLAKRLLKVKSFTTIILTDMTGVLNQLQLGGLQLKQNPDFIELTSKIKSHQTGFGVNP